MARSRLAPRYGVYLLGLSVSPGSPPSKFALRSANYCVFCNEMHQAFVFAASFIASWPFFHRFAW
jgi:hypothetical protein